MTEIKKIMASLWRRGYGDGIDSGYCKTAQYLEYKVREEDNLELMSL